MVATSNTTKPTKKNSAQELVLLRNRFYYLGYRKLTLIFLAALFLCVFSLASAFYFAGRKTPPVYVPIAPNGQIVPTYSLDQPSNSDQNVMSAWVKQWALDGARKSYTYDYLNFGEQVNSAQTYFTYRGWENFIKALTQSQNFNTVQQQRMIVKFIPTTVPVIVDEKVVEGRYAWVVQFKAVIQYVAHDGVHQGFRQNVLVKMKLYRMSTVDSPRGIGIDQVVLDEIDNK